MDSPIRVLYDGWPLVYDTLEPAALHLRAVLASLPPQVEPLLALPGPAPAGLSGPENMLCQFEPTPATSRGRLEWEQRAVPEMAQDLSARLIHLTHASAPLVKSLPVLMSPTGPTPATGGPRTVSARLRSALGKGGLSRLNGLLWPQDLSPPDDTIRPIPLPPLIHPDFWLKWDPQPKPDTLDLPEAFILYHGPYHLAAIQTLLNAWSWGAGSLGSFYPIVMAGMDNAARGLLTTLRADYDFGESLIDLPTISPTSLPELYRHSSALFHPVPEPPWGGPVRRALACGIPVVAAEGRHTNEVAGSAAYLVPAAETRALGAALITVIVEEEVASQLKQAATKQIENWRARDYGESLLGAYCKILESV